MDSDDFKGFFWTIAIIVLLALAAAGEKIEWRAFCAQHNIPLLNETK